MGSKNLVKPAQGTHPPKSGNFGGSSVIKYLFLLSMTHTLATKPTICMTIITAEQQVYEEEL
jgi:hypothetical protein